MKFPRAMAALLLLTAAIAQDDKFTARTNLVFLPTRVQTKKGDTIYGLRPEQFVVEDNGVRQKIKIDEDVDARGLALVGVVQCSRAACRCR